MSFDVLSDLNWLAVLVAGLAYFALGGIWYAPPVFGKAWMKSAGFEMPPDGQRPGPIVYVGPLVTCFVSAVATGMLAAATASDTFGEGICLGLVVGIGYALSQAFVVAMFESNKPAKGTWFLINGSYYTLGLILTSVIVSVWT
jgi:hypothetical protein